MAINTSIRSNWWLIDDIDGKSRRQRSTAKSQSLINVIVSCWDEHSQEPLLTCILAVPSSASFVGNRSSQFACGQNYHELRLLPSSLGFPMGLVCCPLSTSAVIEMIFFRAYVGQTCWLTCWKHRTSFSESQSLVDHVSLYSRRVIASTLCSLPSTPILAFPFMQLLLPCVLFVIHQNLVWAGFYSPGFW